MSLELAIFGRAPVAGRAKTRLSPALGSAGAAALYAAFLEDVLARAHALSGAHVRFWCADDTPHPALDVLLANTPRAVQPAGDLGQRMLHALNEGITRRGGCLLIGSDAPTLPASYLELGRNALGETDVVLGVSADGGYYAVGARRTHTAMFDAVRWSTRFALADTERACRRVGLTVTRLPGWYDVDTPRDLSVLRAHLALEPQSAPASARWLTRAG